MTKYFFIFGKTPKLSKAETENVLKKHSIEFKQILFEKEIFLIESKKKIPTEIFNQLGGSIKFGQIIEQSQTINQDFLAKIINTQIEIKKITFGLSNYTNQNLNLGKLGIETKRILKQKKPCRFVKAKDHALTAVAAQKNKLLDLGIEICIFHQHGIFLIGKTLAVQDFERWNKLDYGRPEFDPKIGMLPPKVAQMMLNLIPTKAYDLWDPFCGFGTILQQAAILGIKNIFGSDKNKMTIQKAQQNIDWLQNKFKIDSKIELQTLDIIKTTKKDLPFIPDAIVAEPYLGKPLTGRETETELIKTKKDLQQLYLKSFEVFKQILPEQAYIIFIFPKFKFQNQIVDTGDDQNLKQLGFKLLSEFDYSRPKQHLIRRITVWEKQAS